MNETAEMWQEHKGEIWNWLANAAQSLGNTGVQRLLGKIMPKPQNTPQPQRHKTSQTNDPFKELGENILSKVEVNLKTRKSPAMELQLRKDELPEGSSKVVNRVYINGKTITAGYSENNGQYELLYFITANTRDFFAGRIAVGASVETIEDFFGIGINNLSNQQGRVQFNTGQLTTGTGGIIEIHHNNSIITQIGLCMDGITCDRTDNFIDEQMQAMNLQDMFQE